MYRIAVTAPLQGDGALAATVYATYLRAPQFVGTGVLAATAAGVSGTFCQFSGAGTLSVTAVATKFDLTANLVGGGILSAAAYPSTSIPAVLSGTGTLTTSAALYKIAANATPAGQGTLSASTVAILLRTAVLRGAGILSASTSATHPRSAALHSSGTLSVAAIGSLAASPNLVGVGTLSATAFIGVTGTTAEASGVGTLTATILSGNPASIESVASYDLTATSVSVQLVQPPAAGECKFYLTDEARQHEVGIRWRDGNLIATHNNIDVASTTYSISHQWQRMRESGGTLYYETSNNGISWIVLGSIAAPYWMSAVHVGLATASFVSAVYDNLNIPSAYPHFSGIGALSSITWMYSITSSGGMAGRGALGAYVSPTAANFFPMFT
jgi:hypothetical protein